MEGLQDKVVIVTGATGGQGEAEVRLLVAAGAKVVFGGRSEADGTRIADELGDHAVFQRHNVGDEAEWQAIVATAEERFGRVDGLVNNAGVTITGLLTDVDAGEVMDGIRTNQLGVLLGMKHVVPAMRRAGGGSIVNIGSEAGTRGYPQAIAYSGTKAAVAGMTRTASAELAADRIRVNLVMPGPIDTPMISNASGSDAADRLAKTVNRLGKLTPYRRASLTPFSDGSRVVPVVHRRAPRPAPRAATSAGGDGRGRCLWTHRVNPGDGGPGEGFQAASRFLKRQLSLPVSTMSQWWVSRSRSAVVILASPKTVGHSPKARLVVTTTEVCS